MPTIDQMPGIPPAFPANNNISPVHANPSQLLIKRSRLAQMLGMSSKRNAASTKKPTKAVSLSSGFGLKSANNWNAPSPALRSKAKTRNRSAPN